MALHPSLVELAEEAGRCESLPAARGILAESHELARNALHHRADAQELAAWYSRVVHGVVYSPAVDSPVRLTGPIARGDGLPGLPVDYLGPANAELNELLTSAGVEPRAVEDALIYRADAGLTLSEEASAALLRQALGTQPPALQLVNGLPDPYAAVDIHSFLLAPLASVARWAAPAPRPTADRLAIGTEKQLLTPAEGEALTLAWRTGLELYLRAWLNHAGTRRQRLADLPPLDRTAYGSACRTVSATLQGIAARAS